MPSILPLLLPSILSEQRNAQSRAAITARLGKKAETSGFTKTPQKSVARRKPVLPRFREEEGNLTADFVARAEALACSFLADGKVVSQKAMGSVLRSFFERRRNKKAVSSVLFDSAEGSVLEKLGIDENLGNSTCLTALPHDITGTDFLPTPFPPFSLQRATAGVAETGSLVFANTSRAQAILAFLPTTHIVLLRQEDIQSSWEQVFAEHTHAPSSNLWALHCVSGPSRTADIEQTLHMGAHGPKELCILLYR